MVLLQSQSAACGSPSPQAYPRLRSCGRVAEGGGLLNRYRLVKAYRGFESLRLRHLPALAAPILSPAPMQGRQVARWSSNDLLRHSHQAIEAISGRLQRCTIPITVSAIEGDHHAVEEMLSCQWRATDVMTSPAAGLSARSSTHGLRAARPRSRHPTSSRQPRGASRSHRRGPSARRD